ncbi:MAG TPA: prolyl oligopeptidase family serine peptidase [Thermoanaerobaculia bacterium]
MRFSWVLPLALAGLLGMPSADAQGGATAPEVTLELIMADPEWIGNPPERPYWADDGGAVYFEQERPGEDDVFDLVRVDLASGGLTVLDDSQRGGAGVAGGDWSRDRRFKVYSREGDVYLHDVAGGEIRQLTRTVEPESAPRFLAGDRRVAFHRGRAVFVRDLESGLEYQVAELQLADDPAEEEPPEDFLARQQRRLFDWVREQREDEERAREREREARREDPSRVPPPWYLGDDVELVDSALAPGGDWMLLVVADKDRQRGKRDQMPNYVSAGGYVTIEDVRPKVGTGDGKGERLVALDLEAHRRFELDLSALPGIAEDPLAELRRLAQERKEKRRDEEKRDEDEDEEPEEDGEAKPRQVNVAGVRFAPDGRFAAFMARSVDNKDRWLALVERPAGGEAPALTTVHRLHDPAWINWEHNGFDWLEDGRRLWYQSEETGFSQLYLYSLDDASARPLTAGESVVDEPAVSPDQRFVYFVANPDHPGVYEVYRVPVAGGASEQLTRLGGVNSFTLSPDGARLLVTHSTTTSPPELFLVDLAADLPAASARRLTHTASEAFSSISWTAPEIVAVPSSHQERPIWSRFYPPRELMASDATRDADGRRAAVIFIHGAGYLQNAHQGWSGYFREFMFHTLLTRHGYLVLDMDYRGSRGYGRDWRTAIYRDMGGPELEDLADGVAWLVERHGVDPRRLGVYGGSYGGFLTFMALFKRPELFACGAALRPVTDWAHYNHPYTSNILNTPELDPEAYERSSPIELAAGLARPLLICSGMQDDNVLFQDTVRLAQRLIELGKEDWELAIYPIEAHGFVEPASWLDEYRRIFKLFRAHLLP